MDLLKKIEHTFLKADATSSNLQKLCTEAKQYGFGLVAINPAWIKFCRQELQGSGILVDAAVGFPLGQTLSETKVSEAKQCLEVGAEEIDMIMNVGKLIEGDDEYVYTEIKAVTDVCHQCNVLCKVILETALLDKEQIVRACQLAEKAGADYVKTSTGFSTGGATVEDIRLMRQSVSAKVKIKASGGIKNLEQALALIEAGADRLGTSSGVVIAQEWKEKNGKA